MYIPRLRKKGNIINEIKKIDPNTAITEYLIDRLVKEGKITEIQYGNACLINLDELYDYFHKKDNKNEKTKHRRNL